MTHSMVTRSRTNDYEKIKKMGVDDFAINRLLGIGKEGVKVSLASCNCGKIKEVAIKEARYQKLYRSRTVEDDVKLWESLVHERIPKLFNYLCIEEESFVRDIYVMEYVPGVSLFDFSSKKWRESYRFEETEVCNYSRQLIDVLSYIHSQKIVYHDVKLENIMVHNGKNIKLIDFDLSTRTDEKDICTCSRLKGTPVYMSPECISSLPHSYEIDVWGLGILMFELMQRSPPFGGLNLNEIKKKIVEKDISFSVYYHVSDEFKDLITSILKKEKEERLTLDGIKSHKWFMANAS
jgi:serine/threonine protein kinase